jgi:DNA-binding NtrC family response regulator
MIGSVLVVDDSLPIREMLWRALTAEGYWVATAESGDEALSRIARDEFDVILVDIVMPGVGGLEVLERSRRLCPQAAVILMTGHAALDTAIAALRRGACDYLIKPFTVDDLSGRVRTLVEQRGPAARRRLETGMAMPPEPALIGESPAMHAVREQIAKTARRPSTVLITGESGVGKELVARAVHAASERRRRPFIAINCGAIPETLLESQLFGHVRGAFTSAVQANPGLFVAAAGGTLFLDEIGEMPLPLQVKLLRVLEDRQVWPVGATKLVTVDVRIVASTNRDLAGEVAAGRFREDLFYRLDVVRVEVPPLRERRGDIPPLVDHLVQRLNAKLGTRVLGVEPAALAALAEHPWRGNVRELENALERAMVLGSGDVISLADLSPDLAPPAPATPRDLRGAVREFERRHVSAVLAEMHLDKRKAANVLGISLASLYRKLGADADGAASSEQDCAPAD